VLNKRDGQRLYAQSAAPPQQYPQYGPTGPTYGQTQGQPQVQVQPQAQVQPMPPTTAYPRQNYQAQPATQALRGTSYPQTASAAGLPNPGRFSSQSPLQSKYPVTLPGPSQPVPQVAAVPQAGAYPGYPNMGQPAPAEPDIPRGADMESPDPVAGLTMCEGAQPLARVASEPVLGSEVLPLVNEALSNAEGFDNASESDVAMAKEHFLRKLLPQTIDMKLLYVDAKRNLPPEALESIRGRLGKVFEEKEVARRLESLKLNSRAELEEKLASWGTSLAQEKQAFIEKAVSQQWGYEQLRDEEVVTHEQLLDYYHSHLEDYEHPTRVRWEHLEVTFAKHPDRREAWQLMAGMGNAVMQGYPFAQVAKEHSEGAMARKGGQREWITQGSLKSDVIDRSLFSLPVGALSPILEDETGFHIVRVVEREDAHRTPFEEVQNEIREAIKKENEKDRMKEFIARLREEIPVWTIFDEETADSGRPAAGQRF
jgi:hypothetical protein